MNTQKNGYAAFDYTPFRYDPDEHAPPLPIEKAHLLGPAEPSTPEQERYREQAHEAQGMATLLAVLAGDDRSHFMTGSDCFYFFREHSQSEGWWHLHGGASPKLCRERLLEAGPVVLAKALHAVYHDRSQDQPASLGRSPWDEGGSMYEGGAA